MTADAFPGAMLTPRRISIAEHRRTDGHRPAAHRCPVDSLAFSSTLLSGVPQSKMRSPPFLPVPPIAPGSCPGSSYYSHRFLPLVGVRKIARGLSPADALTMNEHAAIAASTASAYERIDPRRPTVHPYFQPLAFL